MKRTLLSVLLSILASPVFAAVESTLPGPLLYQVTASVTKGGKADFSKIEASPNESGTATTGTTLVSTYVNAVAGGDNSATVLAPKQVTTGLTINLRAGRIDPTTKAVETEVTVTYEVLQGFSTYTAGDQLIQVPVVVRVPTRTLTLSLVPGDKPTMLSSSNDNFGCELSVGLKDLTKL